jgi:PAS domain S-box-containing protein
VWASPEARRIYGFGDGELSIPAIQEFPLAPYRPGLDRAMRELVTDGKPYDLEFQVARGSGGAIVDIRSVAEYNAEEHLVLGVVQDITERKRAERALRESEAKFRSYVDLAPVGVVVADETGRHIDANRATEQMLGYGPGGLIGTLVSDMPVPEDAEAARQHFSQVVSTGIADGEVRLRHRDGSTVWVAVRASKIGDNRFLAVYKDVSERKRLEAERERLMRDLARKNRELEHLIYVTSHDLRSPMLNIQGFSQRIEERCRDLVRLIAVESPSVANREELAGILTQHLPKALGYVRTSVDKMDALINGLLRLSRLGRAGLRREQLDLNAVLRDVRDAMAFPIQSAGVVIEVSPLPPCHGDAGQINQVFTNLLDNAIKYRDPVRPLRITVTGRVEGARAIYCVADTGRGIAAKHRDRIWEIFFRANPEGPAKGEGIGLNLVRRIVERHDGEIWVESTEGEGSRFHVALPTTAENGPVQVTGPSELDRPVG